ncbi:MAG: tetratricopeptide repeat protein [SAR324 cluster bacterium]|nr:tetratricopeptide repeat protein [SAR324 cluster bacterium]
MVSANSLKNNPHSQNLPFPIQFFGLIGIVFSVYYPTTQAGFVWDDFVFVVDDPLMTATDGFWRIWFAPGSGPWNYWPLTRSVFWLQRQLWGLNPFGYHLVNITFHLLNSIVLYLALQHFKVRGAWIIGLLFAIHPVHVASVAWVVELKNTLSGLFYLLSIWAFLIFDKNKNWRWYSLSLGLFLFALLSKSSTVMLPVILILLRTWFKKPWRKEDYAVLIPFFLLALSSGLLSIFFENQYIGEQTSGFSLNFLEKILVAGRAALFYIDKFLWPHFYPATYPRWDISSADLKLYLALLFWIGGGGFAIWKHQSWGRPVFLAVFAFWVSLFPVSGILNAAGFSITFVWLHLTYLPSIPIFIFLVQSGIRLSDSIHIKYQFFSHLLFKISTALILILLGVLSHYQSKIFNNAETLWSDTLNKTQSSWMAFQNMGIVYREKNKEQLAIEHFNKAIQINGNLDFTYYNRGNAYLELKQYKQAILDYRKAISLNPKMGHYYNNLGIVYDKLGQYKNAIYNYTMAISLNTKEADFFSNRGLSYEKNQQYEEAIQDHTQAIFLDPKKANYYNYRGVAYGKLKRSETAIKNFTQAIAIDPSVADYYNNRGVDYEKLRDYKSAIQDFSIAIEHDPKNARYYQNRGRIYKILHQYSEAVQDFNQAIKFNPNDAEMFKNRGILFSNLKQYEQAIKDYGKALQIDPKHSMAYYNRGLTFAKLQRFEKALQDFNQVLKLSPENIEAYNIRGYFHWILKKSTEACLDWKNACKLGDCQKYIQSQQKKDCLQ